MSLSKAGILTESVGSSQLRDSDGFSPFFPRFLLWLIPTETSELLYLVRVCQRVFGSLQKLTPLKVGCVLSFSVRLTSNKIESSKLETVQVSIQLSVKKRKQS